MLNENFKEYHLQNINIRLHSKAVT